MPGFPDGPCPGLPHQSPGSEACDVSGLRLLCVPPASCLLTHSEGETVPEITRHTRGPEGRGKKVCFWAGNAIFPAANHFPKQEMAFPALPLASISGLLRRPQEISPIKKVA